MGKSQLTAVYAKRFEEEYDAILWVRANDPATLSTDYSSLAGSLQLSDADVAGLGPQEVIDAVRHKLEATNLRILLVMDDAPSFEAVRSYLPRSGRAHILITSRDPAWRAVATPYELDRLNQTDAIHFLIHRTGRRDRTEAAALAKDLVWFPLTLEQAGAYMETKGVSFAEYRRLYQTNWTHLMAEHVRAGDYSHTVLTTWNVAFTEVARSSPLAAGLLRLFACLGPESIDASGIVTTLRRFAFPDSRILAFVMRIATQQGIELPITLQSSWVKIAQLQRLMDDDPLATEAVVRLHQYALVHLQPNGTLLMHELVQRVVRDRLTDREHRKWIGIAVLVLNDVFPEDADDPQQWPLAARLIGLVQAVAAQVSSSALLDQAKKRTLICRPEHFVEQVDMQRIILPTANSLLNKAGTYLKSQAQYPAAISVGASSGDLRGDL